MCTDLETLEFYSVWRNDMGMTSGDVAKLLGLSLRRVTQGAKALNVKKYGHLYWWEDSEIDELKKRIGKKGDKLAK